MTPDLSIYLVTDAGQSAGAGRGIVETVLAAVAGGVTAVQVRDKAGDARALLSVVSALSAQLPEHVTVLVNDRVDVFLAARAAGDRVDGVHVGQADIPAALVRTLIGPDAVLGVTTSTLDEVHAAVSGPARVDYLGLGAVHATTSKHDAPLPVGIGGVIDLAAAAPVPCVAIGGLTPEDLPGLRAGGLAGAAVVSWICASPDPQSAAHQLRTAWAVAA